MSYTVLARKYRSQTLDEVVGQGPVIATLRNAIEQGRIHHGYLFCGTRGVGKTSMARILAKCLNCLSSDGPTVKPCGTCDACVGIARGDDVDVVEIDAASNTGVDNIRELRSNAVYRPARCRFKIYIIDEVHMLSMGAFNALLKTLEEPPGHVKFIFATTETHKVPATILSRVQRFDFRTIPPDQIAERMAEICKAEEVRIEDAALKRVARLANGSMRDALSLLDQVISIGGRKIAAAVVDELFPPAHDAQFALLIDQLADGNAAGAIEQLDTILNEGYALDHWCSMFINQLRNLMILRICGEKSEIVDVPAALREKLMQQAARFDPGAYVYLISVLEELRRSVKSGGAGRALVEAAVIRMAEASNFSSLESLMAHLQDAQPGQPVAGGATAPRTATPPAMEKKKLLSGSERDHAGLRTGIGVNGGVSAATAGNPAGEGRVAGKRAEISVGTRNQTEDRPAMIESGPVSGPSTDSRSSLSLQPAASLVGGRTVDVGRRTSQADKQRAMQEPIVKATVEAFGGHIVRVQQFAGGDSPPAIEPVEAEDAPVALNE